MRKILFLLLITILPGCTTMQKDVKASSRTRKPSPSSFYLTLSITSISGTSCRASGAMATCAAIFPNKPAGHVTIRNGSTSPFSFMRGILSRVTFLRNGPLHRKLCQSWMGKSPTACASEIMTWATKKRIINMASI